MNWDFLYIGYILCCGTYFLVLRWVLVNLAFVYFTRMLAISSSLELDLEEIHGNWLMDLRIKCCGLPWVCTVYSLIFLCLSSLMPLFFFSDISKSCWVVTNTADSCFSSFLRSCVVTSRFVRCRPTSTRNCADLCHCLTTLHGHKKPKTRLQLRWFFVTFCNLRASVKSNSHWCIFLLYA